MPTCSITMNVIMKIITVATCILMIGVSILTFIKLGGFHLARIIMAVYWIIFALVLLLGQFGVKWMISKFRLLGFQLGRAIYCIVIGATMIQVNSEDKFGLLELICAGVLFGLGVMHVITFCVAKKSNNSEVVQNYTEFK